MDGENLITHVENLTPGIVTLAAICVHLSSDLNLSSNSLIVQTIQQPFIAAIIFVAASYLLGTVIFVFSRLFVDSLSAITFRPLLLKIFNWDDFPSCYPSEVNKKYRATIKKVLDSNEKNAVRQELAIRRQRGRVIRTAIVPLALTFWSTSDIPMLIILLLSIVAIYSYSEVSIYQEAKLYTP